MHMCRRKDVGCIFIMTFALTITLLIRSSIAIPTQGSIYNDWDNFFENGEPLVDAINVPSSSSHLENNYDSEKDKGGERMDYTSDFASALGSDVPQTETMGYGSDLVSGIPETESTEPFSPFGSVLPTESNFGGESTSSSYFETYESGFSTQSATPDNTLHVMFRVGESESDFDREYFLSSIVNHLDIESSQLRITTVQGTDTTEEIDVHCALYSGPSGSAAHISNQIENAMKEGHKDLVELHIIYYITHQGDVIYFASGQNSKTAPYKTLSARPSASQTDPKIHTIEMIVLSRLSLFDEAKFVKVVSSISKISATQISIKNVSEFHDMRVFMKKLDESNKTSVIYDVLHGDKMSSTKASKAIMDTVMQGHKGYTDIGLLMAKLNDDDFISYIAKDENDTSSEGTEMPLLILIIGIVGVFCGLGILIGLGYYLHKNKHHFRYFVFKWKSSRHAELDEEEEAHEETQQTEEQGDEESKPTGKNIEMVDLLKAAY